MRDAKTLRSRDNSLRRDGSSIPKAKLALSSFKGFCLLLGRLTLLGEASSFNSDLAVRRV